MWPGIGGLITALLAMGARIIAVSIEKESALRAAQAKCLYGLVHMANVEDFEVASLKPLLAQKTFKAIIVG